MGNRSTIYVVSKTHSTPVAIYGHWAGKSSVDAVVNVLTRTDRVGDAMYLTAQVFYEFAITLGSYEGGTGFGIGTFETIDDHWNDNPAIILDADTGGVTYEGVNYTQEEFIEWASTMNYLKGEE
jgi:hypothetical protein